MAKQVAVDRMWNADFVRLQFRKLPVHDLYPEVRELMENVVIGWLDKFTHEVIRRMFRRNRIFKEFNEISPIIPELLSFLDAQEEPCVLIDLCSGFGFLAMFLSEIVPVDKISRILLVDNMWEDPNDDDSSAQVITTQHIFEYEWPVRLEVCKRDIQLETGKVLGGLEDDNVIICAIHLCGTLSVRAVEIFNSSEKVKKLFLKPCCLPGRKKPPFEFTLGSHHFLKKDVYQRRGYGNKFHSWCENISMGINASKNMRMIEISTCAEKQHRKNTFIYGNRDI